MKIKFDSDDNLPLNKSIEIPLVTTVARAAFHENNKYYPLLFFQVNVYKNIKMLHYDRIYVSEGIDVNKTSVSKGCDACHNCIS